MADTEGDLLAEAIANTETEIFSEAVGKDLPSTEGGPGDRAVEEMGTGLEGQHDGDEPEEGEGEGEGEGETQEAQPEGDKEGDGQTRDPATGRFVRAEPKVDDQQIADASAQPNRRVPLAELLSERKARQDLQAQLREMTEGREKDRTDARGEYERLNARLDQLLVGRHPAQAPQPQPQLQPEQPRRSDVLFEDPDRFVSDIERSVEQRLTQRFVSADLARTHREQGERFETAYRELTSLPQNDPSARLTVQRIWNSMTPGNDILEWHEQQVREREVRAAGGLDKYRDRVAAETREALANDPEFRKQLLESMRSDAGSYTGGAPRTVTRLPKSLNGASGGSEGVAQNQGGSRFSSDSSDRGVFEDAFRDFAS